MAIQGQDITYNINQLQDLLDKVNNLGDATTETAGLMSAEDKQKVDSAITQETDPTVPSWAKAEEKPTYTATEVGALPEDTELFSGSYNDLTDKPTIPDSLSDLSDDSTHRLVTDAEKTAWNGKSDFSGSYDDLTDKPTIPAAQVNADWNATSGVAKILNKPTIPAEQIQSDWNQSNTSAKDYIKNKPTIPDISNCITKSPTSGLVKNDGTIDTNTYLTQHQDISNYVQKSSTSGLLKNDGTVDTSTYLTSAHEVPSGGNAGQVLSKNSATDYDVHWVSQTTTYPSAYCTTAGGTALKVANCSLWTATANTYLHILMGVSNTYQGELKLKVNSNPSAAGAPIYINGVVSSSTNYTLPSGSYIIFYDGTNFYFNTDGTIPNVLHKSSTSGLVKNDGSIDTNTYLTQHQDISNYVQKSNTTGLLKNDGSVDTTSYGTYSKPAGGIPASDIASGVIPTVPSNIVTGSSQSYTIWSGTQAQYDALATKDNNTIYLIKES